MAAASAGSAVATMVWSTTARNIGSMIEGKTVRNAGFGAAAGTIAVAVVGAPPAGALPAADAFGSSGASCNAVGPGSRRSMSVRHQDRQAGICQDVTRGSAEHHLPQSALCIGALHQQVAALFGRVLERGLARRLARPARAGLDHQRLRLDAVA